MWEKDLVAVYRSRIPPWYNGQCPLVEPDRLVIATGGDAVMVALDKATGKEILAHPQYPERDHVACVGHAGGARRHQAVPLRHARYRDGRVRQRWQAAMKFS